MGLPSRGHAGLCFRAVLGACLTLACGAPAWAQGHTPDPYNIVGEYNGQYEPYIYASEPNGEGMFPNQNRLESRAANPRGSNRFQSYLDGLDEGDEAAGGPARYRGAFGVPYYRSARDLEPRADRQYRPNKEADEGFYESQRRRSAEYEEATRVTDPKRRAQMLRDLNQESLRASRTAPATRTGTRPATGGASGTQRTAPDALAPVAPRPGSAAASRLRSEAPAFRRNSAPSPPPAAPRALSPGLSTPDVDSLLGRRRPATPSARRSATAERLRRLETPEDLLDRSPRLEPPNRLRSARPSTNAAGPLTLP